jgi:hypothetical protein
MIARCAALSSCGLTRTALFRTRRPKSDVYAISRSPVTCATLESGPLPSKPHGVLHCAPPGRISCPSVSDGSNPRPAIFGPGHRLWLRVQRYTQAAAGLSGSRSAAAHSPQPQDQTVASGISRFTCLIASTCHLIVSNHALAGLRCSRPPWPGFVWNPRKIPIFDGEIPIEVRSVTPRRKAFRSVRDPSTGPCR